MGGDARVPDVNKLKYLYLGSLVIVVPAMLYLYLTQSANYQTILYLTNAAPLPRHLLDFKSFFLSFSLLPSHTLSLLSLFPDGLFLFLCFLSFYSLLNCFSFSVIINLLFILNIHSFGWVLASKKSTLVSPFPRKLICLFSLLFRDSHTLFLSVSRWCFHRHWSIIHLP